MDAQEASRHSDSESQGTPGEEHLLQKLSQLKNVCAAGSSAATKHVVAVAQATEPRKPDPAELLKGKALENLNTIAAAHGLDEIGAIIAIGTASMNGIGSLVLRSGNRISPCGLLTFMMSYGKSVGKTRYFELIRSLIQVGHFKNGRGDISSGADRLRLASFLHNTTLAQKNLIRKLPPKQAEHSESENEDAEDPLGGALNDSIDSGKKSEAKRAKKAKATGEPRVYSPKLESFTQSGLMNYFGKKNLCRSPLILQDEGRMLWQKVIGGGSSGDNELNEFFSTLYSTGTFEKTQGLAQFCYDIPFCNMSAWVPVHADYVLQALGPRLQECDPTGVCIRGFWPILEPRPMEVEEEQEDAAAETAAPAPKPMKRNGKKHDESANTPEPPVKKSDQALSQVAANLAIIYRHYDDVQAVADAKSGPGILPPEPQVLTLDPTAFKAMQDTVDQFMQQNLGEEHVTDCVGKMSNLASRLACLAHFAALALKGNTTRNFPTAIGPAAASFGLRLALWSMENFMRMHHWKGTPNAARPSSSTSANPNSPDRTTSSTDQLPWTPATNTLVMRAVRSTSSTIESAAFKYNDLKSSLNPRMKIHGAANDAPQYLKVNAQVWRDKLEKAAEGTPGLHFDVTTGTLTLGKGLPLYLESITAKKHLLAIQDRDEAIEDHGQKAIEDRGEATSSSSSSNAKNDKKAPPQPPSQLGDFLASAASQKSKKNMKRAAASGESGDANADADVGSSGEGEADKKSSSLGKKKANTSKDTTLGKNKKDIFVNKY
eukprot:CAMPEP_0178982872 /NCGR_PEP_ID=MMETSP0795-20121207/737_1 /TAXON_ID=88552 /ORGANISM="Amoebophrya sp., Strain Ameob2" /LENGTH=772 /DNA_ID=CAMNT_0020673565 /DNA_START=12 /DNA_END=2330 /DNA_ORIENTATION=-